MSEQGVIWGVFQCGLLLEDGSLEEGASLLRLLILEGDIGKIMKCCCETALGYRIRVYTADSFQGLRRGFERMFRLLPGSDDELRLPETVDGSGVFETESQIAWILIHQFFHGVGSIAEVIYGNLLSMEAMGVQPERQITLRELMLHEGRSDFT